MRLGIIARSDNTGLGNQTRELVNMLNPDKILLIDSTTLIKINNTQNGMTNIVVLRQMAFPLFNK